VNGNEKKSTQNYCSIMIVIISLIRSWLEIASLFSTKRKNPNGVRLNPSCFSPPIPQGGLKSFDLF
jgi:hypothetical protein